jgi:hypothetical protein
LGRVKPSAICLFYEWLTEPAICLDKGWGVFVLVFPFSGVFFLVCLLDSRLLVVFAFSLDLFFRSLGSFWMCVYPSS